MDEVKAKGKELESKIKEEGRVLRKLVKSQQEMMVAKVNDYVKKFVDKDPVNEVSCFLKNLELSVRGRILPQRS